MRKLKMVMLTMLVAVSLAACGGDNNNNNNKNDAGAVDTGMADAGGMDAGACDPGSKPTCCDTTLQAVAPVCNADTTEWSCPSGSTQLPIGGVCGQSDAGTADTGTMSDAGGGDAG